jgi:hypothetical protein
MDEPGFGARFVADNPGVRFLKAFVIDVNGIARCKWISCSFEEVSSGNQRRGIGDDPPAFASQLIWVTKRVSR